MTPRPEEIELAERIGHTMDDASVYHEARKRMLADMTGADIDLHLVKVAGGRAALAAIMEVREKVAEMMDEDYNYSAAAAIRDGEYLR